MITSLVSRWTPACFKSTIQDLEKVNSVTRVFLIQAWSCLTKKLMKKLPQLWNSEKVKTLSQLYQQLRDSRKNLLPQKKFQTDKFLNPMILELLEDTISLMAIETRRLVDLATPLDLSKLSNQGWSLSMEKMCQTFQCSKFSIAITWLRDVLEDGHISMLTSWSMLIWLLKNALLILQQQRDIHALLIHNANQRPKFKILNL